MFKANQDLVSIGRILKAEGYQFTAVTPLTRERVLRQEPRDAHTLRDIFGWNKVFQSQALPPVLLNLAAKANVLEVSGDRLRSKIGFSTIGDRLFVHSAVSQRVNNVAFGPDEYRFCNFIERSLGPCTRLVSLGCGCGVGGLYVSGKAQHVTLADANHHALEFAAVNAELSSLPVALVHGDWLDAVEGPIDAIITSPRFAAPRSTPPADDGSTQQKPALNVLKSALSRLQPGGTFLLYTRVAIIKGEDTFGSQVARLCTEADATFEYRELDPDVYSHDFEAEHIERVAAVSLIVKAPTYTKPVLLNDLPGPNDYLH